jgi:osmotically-inducible protein OsmY
MVLTFPVRAARRGIDDRDIALAIERDLLCEETVPAHLLDVQTQQGIVRLSGSVGHLLAKEQAVRIAQGVRGVRSVIDQIRLRPVEHSDGDIRNDVVKALAYDPAADSYEIEVNVKNGTVTLSGTVDSWAEKQLAGQVAKGVKGVKKMENGITVEYRTPRPDSEIKAEVERRLELDPYISDGLIEVNVKDGKVTLTGTVGSPSERSGAYAKSWVNGVGFVDTQGLQVEPWARDGMRRGSKFADRSDEEIERAVQEALAHDPRVFCFNVGVEVEGGSVTLSGTVDNLKARKAAERDARHTIGVWMVENYLKVRPTPSEPDDQIAEHVRDALGWDPVVERHEIIVAVRNGKVYLYGMVDSFYERDHAEDVASRVSGVVDVANYLAVEKVWTWKSDQKIKEDIEDQLFWSFYVDGDDISVSVEDGVVILRGSVESWQALKAAVKNAFEGGARIVKGRLKVQGNLDYYPEYHYKTYYFWLD